MDLDHDPIFTWSDGSPTQTATEFTEQNIQFRDGSMILKEESMCTAEHPDCYPAYSSYAQETTAGVPVAIPARPLVSGELRSRYNNYRYGRYEAKFRGPTTGSDYLSSLFTSRTPRGPVWNEIDFSILPYKPKQTSGGIFSATNSTTLPASNYQWTGDVDVPLKYNIINEHVYAFTWTPSAIDWYVDGTLIKHFSGQPDVPLPTSSAKIMMNIWSYGGNSPDSYTSEVAYEYFRFYKLDAETTYPCSPAPECLKKTAVGDYTAASRNNPSETKYGE